MKIWHDFWWLVRGGVPKLKAERNRLQNELDQNRALLAVKSEVPGICFNYGNLLVENGRFDQALHQFELSEALGNQASIFHLYHGNLLDRMGHFEAATHQWEKSVAQDTPERLAAYSDIIMRLVFHGDRILATQWLAQVRVLWEQSVASAATQGDHRRFLSVDYSTIIGHISLIDYYVKAGELGWRKPGLQPVLLAPPQKAVNPTLISYWNDHLEVEDSSEKIASFGDKVHTQQDCIGYTVFETGAYHYWEAWALVQQEWERQGRAPLLKLREEHAARGWETLRQHCGMTSEDWFVCLHVREAGFHGDHKGLYQTTRNADIKTYDQVIRQVRERGGWVIRLGDPTMQPLPGERILDYARSPIKNDCMDVFLCGAARLFVGSSSGLAHVPPLFGVPCALTNWTPCGLRSSYGADRFIPKLIWSKKEARYLSFREMMQPPVHHWQYPLYYAQAELELRDNSSEELGEFVSEMLEDSTPLSAEQQIFEKLAKEENCYGMSPIGRQFVVQHADLLN